MIGILTAAFVTFREGFEALLLTMLMTNMVRDRGLDWRALAAGIGIGIAGSTMLAFVIHDWVEHNLWFESAIDLTAAAVLTYVVIWNRHVQAHINEHIQQVKQQSLLLVTMTISLIFLREGAEIVLMLYSAVLSDPWQAGFGSAVGIATLGCVAYFMLNRLGKLPRIDNIFKYSNYLLAAMAAWFYVQAAFGFFG